MVLSTGKPTLSAPETSNMLPIALFSGIGIVALSQPILGSIAPQVLSDVLIGRTK